jgi:hypothetical protein
MGKGARLTLVSRQKEIEGEKMLKSNFSLQHVRARGGEHAYDSSGIGRSGTHAAAASGSDCPA